MILNEVDCLEHDSVLHALYDLENVTMVVVMISEDDLLARCDSWVQSRLRSMTTVALEKYSHVQLVDILRAGLVGPQRDRVDGLGTHKRLLYDIIEAAGDIGATELRETYEQRCSEPKAGCTGHRYLTSLEGKYELITSRTATSPTGFESTGIRVHESAQAVWEYSYAMCVMPMSHTGEVYVHLSLAPGLTSSYSTCTVTPDQY